MQDRSETTGRGGRVDHEVDRFDLFTIGEPVSFLSTAPIRLFRAREARFPRNRLDLAYTTAEAEFPDAEEFVFEGDATRAGAVLLAVVMPK